MKLTLFLLLLTTPFLSVAQKKHKDKAPDAPPPPRVWVGNIHTYYASRDSILAHPVLNTDSVGCRVSGFTISLQAPGQPFYGPLYAVGWEFTQVQKDVIAKWDYPDVTFYVQDIHLNCHEKDATSPPFQFMYNKK